MEFDAEEQTVKEWNGGNLTQQLGNTDFFYGGGGVLPDGRIATVNSNGQTQVYDPRDSSSTNGGFKQGLDVSNYHRNQAVVTGTVHYSFKGLLFICRGRQHSPYRHAAGVDHKW